MRAFKGFIFLALVSPFMANAVSAATIPFALSDFMVSTTTTSGVNLSSSPGSAPALPADSTFTLPPDATNTYLSSGQGKFLRFSFNLPSGFQDLTFDFQALVNDEFALYVNDTVVAMQTSTGTDNFAAPLPGFSLNAAGTAVDTSGKLEYLLTSGMQSLFHAGTNELTLFGTDTLQYGGIGSIDGTISVAPVPEPAVYQLMLAGLGLLLVVASRRSRRQQRSVAVS